MSKNFDWLLNTPIAHRGLHDENTPENSIPAFEKAIEFGYSIEIDVHLTKDNQLVVFHDANLNRVCGVNRTVKSCTVEELKQYRLKGTDCTIPTLDEFLAFVDGRVGILCEVKGVIPWDVRIARATVERFKSYNGNVALQSFNFGAVICFRKHSDRPFGQLVTWGGDKLNHWADIMGKLHLAKISKPEFIAYDIRNYKAGKKYIDKELAKGKKLILWTVNSPEKLELAREVADNIIFEKPCGLLNEN